MAAQCPLVVTDLPGHRELLDDTCAKFVRPDDPRALAAALREVLTDRVSARARARIARERVETRTIQRTADAYERVYVTALAREAARAAKTSTVTVLATNSAHAAPSAPCVGTSSTRD